MDMQLQELQRQLQQADSKADKVEVVAKILVHRLRNQSLTEEKVRFCANLGDPSCLLIFPDVPQITSEEIENLLNLDYSEINIASRIIDSYKFINKKYLFDFSTWCAEKAAEYLNLPDINDHIDVLREGGQISPEMANNLSRNIYQIPDRELSFGSKDLISEERAILVITGTFNMYQLSTFAMQKRRAFSDVGVIMARMLNVSVNELICEYTLLDS